MKWLGYAWAAGAIATCTLVGLLFAPWLEQVNIALVYLLGVVLVALRWRRGPVVAASILAIAAYNFFFVPPSGTFHVDDPQYLAESFVTSSHFRREPDGSKMRPTGCEVDRPLGTAGTR